MSIKRGVVADYTTTSVRPITAKSILPIAFVLASKTKMSVGLHAFDGVESATTYIADNAITDADGNVKKYIELAKLFNATAPIVISIVKTVTDAAETKTRYLAAIDALRVAHSVTSYVPDIVVVPDFAYDLDIINATESVCQNFGARTFVDFDAATNDDAIIKRNAFGSSRITPAKSGGSINDVFYDAGALMAWARVTKDGDADGYGWSRSISNFILPISAVKHPSTFVMGRADDTDPLTEAQITSIIFHKGFRLWEYSTTSADPIWQDARRVRIFDKISEATLDGIFFAIDQGIDELRQAKKSLREFVANLVGAGVVLGADDVVLDEDLTTTTALTKGEFYFRINLQEMPSPKLIKVTYNRVDKFAPVLYELLTVA